MEAIIKEIKNIYDLSLMLFIVGIGLILVFWDSTKLKRKSMTLDANIARIIGKVYIAAAVIIYVILQFF